MKSNCKRLLSLALVLMLVLSMVPTMAFAAEDSASAYVAENTATGEQYVSINDAIMAAQAGQIVKVLADAQDVVYSNEGVILDLNGHNLSNVTVSDNVTLSAIDSATDDYEGDYGTLTTEGEVATTVKTSGEVKSYVTIGENGSYSFHRYYASIAAISLKPAQAALGYRAEFRGDEAVKNAIVGYGYELWVNGGAHKQYTKNDALENSSLTLRLKNILSEGNDALNALGSTATIGGNAYIALELNGQQVTLYGAEQQTTLRQVIESINANVSGYGEAQLQSVCDMITTYASWMESWATDAIFGLGNAPEDGGDLKVEITVDVTAENGVLTQDATLSNEDITVTVPQGTVLESGTTQLVLTITEKASSDSGIAEEEGYTLIPLDVHIEGISADNTTPIIVGLGEVLPKGLNIGNYELYHVENGQTVTMTYVSALSELDTHNEFCYNPATGAVTVAVASFSEIALRSTAAAWKGEVDHSWYNTTDTTLYIYNADQLWSLSQIVGDMADGIAQDSFAGKTVILHADIDLNDLDPEDGRVFYPIGYWNSEGTYEKSGTAISSGFYTFEGTFDGNGHTIANFYHNTWEMKGDHNWYDATEQRYRDGMGLFGKVYGGTVKNLTVKNFSSDGEIATTGTIAAYADCGATFENITIFDCNPRVYNIGNGGIVGCVGWYNNEETDENPVTFKNITVDNSNKVSALWGSWDVACGGLVGQYYPTSGQTNATKNAGIHMENCHVTAQIDVNNDVCANYQYYAYRYAGILIGSVRENVNGDGSDLYPETGRVYPDMDGITAKDCTVGFGDWNDYYYCELVANSIASYTHDYQFSRLTQVASVDEENMTVTTLEGETVAIPASGRANYVVVTGDHATENAKCYHFVDGAVWNHKDAGYEDSIDEDGDGNVDLKEDKQHIYLEFNNLVTGYGWGVTSMGVKDMEGVTILDKNTAQKFNVYVGAKTTFGTGAIIKLSDLFYSQHTVNTATVQAFVSPVGDDSTVTATYVADKEDWKNGTLTFSGKGAAEIIITDYYFCIATTLSINVENPVVRYWDYNSVFSVDCGDNGVVLPTADAEDGKTFIGWSETEIASTTEAPTVLTTGSTYLPTKAVADLYAVYSYEVAAGDAKTYTLVTDASTLNAGDKLIIVSDGTSDYVAGDISSNVMASVSVTIQDNTINALPEGAVVLTLGGTDGAWTLANDSGALLGATAAKKVAWGSGTTTWSISITGGNATIQNGTSTYGRFLYNVNSPRFTTYTSNTSNTMLLPQLYKENSSSSGEAATYYVSDSFTCEHESTTTTTVAATCTTEGLETVTCNDCREVVSEETVSVIAHNYVDGICTSCGGEKPPAYVLTDIADIREDQPVIITMTTSDGVVYTMVNDNGTTAAPGAIKATMEDDNLIPPADNIYWNIAKDGDYLIIYPNGTTDTWLYSTSDNNGTRVGTNSNKTWTIDETSGYLKHVGTSRYLGVYTTGSDWRAYTNTTGNTANQTLGFYTLECFHNNLQNVDAVAATCSAEGYTAGVQCTDCGAYTEGHETVEKLAHTEVVDEAVAATCKATGLTEGSHCSVCNTVIVAQTVTAMLDHNYVDGTCSVCGEAEPAEKTATLSFADTAYRTTFTTSQQVWEQNGITLTNNKGDSTTNVADYSNPARFYKSSEVIVEFAGMTKIEFTCTSSSYATELKNSIGTVSGATVTVSNSVVTIEFDTAVDSFTIASMSAQVRVSSLTVTYSTES